MRAHLASRGWTPPEKVDEYRLVRWIGGGAMGDVFLAHDSLLDRPVAIKFIAALEPDSDARERFLIEARAAARLSHPNVLTIYRVGEIDRRPYIVSEFLRGKGLDEAPKPIPWQRALEIGVALARGLAAAHRRGVLHRDIKPANAIITEDGGAKLLDFGLAKLVAVRADPDKSQPVANRPAPVRPAPAVSVDPFGSTIHPGAQRQAQLLAPGQPFVPRGDGHGSEGPTAPYTAMGPFLTGGSDLRVAVEGAVDDSNTVAVGTPYYMAPETWRNEQPTRRGDVYSLGALLYELCAQQPPHHEVPIDGLAHVVQERDARPLAEVVPEIDPRFAAVVDRCLRRDPHERFASGDELRDALEQLAPSAEDRGVDLPKGNPYRGLEAFEAQHRALFFGRTAEIGVILERLRTEPFVLVAGDSGVGKSSLCRAGVLPQVEEGALRGGRSWSVVRLVPGRRPLSSLIAALAPVLDTDEEHLAARIAGEHTAIGYELRRSRGADSGLLIFIDQLEELMTISDGQEAADFAELLWRFMTPSPGVRVLATVRGDFLTRVASLPGFGEEIARALYLLRPLSGDAMREAIIGPALAKGFRFESSNLIDGLVASTIQTEGGLPLLQFALAELWEARDKVVKTIPSVALEKIGGVEGALARHADGVLRRLPPMEREATRQILIALVTVDGTRARRSEKELVGESQPARIALEALVRGRLLVAREGEEGTVYEVAHEALIGGWATLRGWLDDSAHMRAARERLSAAAGEWERLGRSRDLLWGKRQLKEAEMLEVAELPAKDVAFLEESEKALTRSQRMFQFAVLGISCIVAIGIVGFRQWKKHDVKKRIDERLEKAAKLLVDTGRKNDQVERLRKEAFKLFDAGAREAGEKNWGNALKASADLERLYGEATQLLEPAVLLDPERSDVREFFGDILYRRAVAADRDGRMAERDELVSRMGNYDRDGKRKAAWEAPGLVRVEITPSGAMLDLERYEKEDSGRLRLERVRQRSLAPIDVALAQGSYLLTVHAANRAPLRFPFLVRRGSDGKLGNMLISLSVPSAAQMPKGFVYVPAGKFLVGTSGEEDFRRQFLNTVPMHEVATNGYLIAMHETTFGEWLEYLNSLSPRERGGHTPRASRIGFTGAIGLKEVSGNWELTLQPTTQAHAYRARLGEKIHYASRTHRGVQDWSRLPVSGISWEDAQSYVRWLRNSGRVSGARLCTELEWERAARGADGREYPHGDQLAPEDANFDATYKKQPFAFGPDEVGSHTLSRSPFGLDDMAGNVWEWTESWSNGIKPVIRGGSYYFDQITNRSANRQEPEPSVRDPSVGMRLCAAPPSR